MQLVSPAPELGDNILGQEFCVATGDIHIHIGNAHKAVEHRLKLTQKLHFVKQDVVFLVIDHLLFHIGIENFWIAVLFVFIGIERNFNNMILCNTTFQQMLFE